MSYSNNYIVNSEADTIARNPNADEEGGAVGTLAGLADVDVAGVAANEVLKYDIVITDKKCDIFDHYWDKYREGFISFKQSEGRANPRLWGNKPKETKKR